MASLMENLIDILEKEIAEYKALLELSERKTPIIIHGDIPSLQKITDEEQDVVGKITHLDQKREEVMKDIANVLNKDVTNLKLRVIIDVLDQRPEEQRRLSAAYDGLKAVVNAVSQINEQNRALLQQSLEMVEFDLNLMKSLNSAPTTAEYDRTAAASGGYTEGMTGNFDARQ